MKKFLLTASLPALAFCLLAAAPDEGMWPISEIHKLNLPDKGLQIDPQEIYNPQGVSLIDAIVNVGGCTGSFVSPQGLILTNHHCAFGAARAASTTEHDYIKNGFLARSRGEEIPAAGYTVRITDSYRDVSQEVLSALRDTMALASRTQAIRKKTKENERNRGAGRERKSRQTRGSFGNVYRQNLCVIYLHLHQRCAPGLRAAARHR